MVNCVQVIYEEESSKEVGETIQEKGKSLSRMRFQAGTCEG